MVDEKTSGNKVRIYGKQFAFGDVEPRRPLPEGWEYLVSKRDFLRVKNPAGRTYFVSGGELLPEGPDRRVSGYAIAWPEG